MDKKKVTRMKKREKKSPTWVPAPLFLPVAIVTGAVLPSPSPFSHGDQRTKMGSWALSLIPEEVLGSSLPLLITDPAMAKPPDEVAASCMRRV